MHFAMFFPEKAGVVYHKIKEVKTFVFLGFRVGEDSTGFEQEEDDTSRVDISSFSVSAGASNQLRRSVANCSLAQNIFLAFSIGLVEIANFEVKVFANEKVIELEVQVGDSDGVDVFQTINKLMEIGTSKLFIKQDSLGHDQIKEIAIRGQFHDGVGNIFGSIIENCFSISFVMNDRQHVLVVQVSKLNFVLEARVDAFSVVGKDFDGKGLGNRGTQRANRCWTR